MQSKRRNQTKNNSSSHNNHLINEEEISGANLSLLPSKSNRFGHSKAAKGILLNTFYMHTYISLFSSTFIVGDAFGVEKKLVLQRSNVFRHNSY